MAQSQSWRHITFILNGHRFESWAEEDDPVDLPKIEPTTFKVGRDGTLYGSDSGERGGEVTVKLAPTSRSAQRCLQWLAEKQRDRDLSFSGIYRDSRTNTSLRLKGGFLMSAHPAVKPGITYEATFRFEELLPAADGGTFAPAPPITV